MATKNDSLKLGRWLGGVNNVLDDQELGSTFLREGINIDIDRLGKVRRRKGYTLKSAGICHSLWSEEGWPFALFVKDGQLTRLAYVDGAEVLTTLSSVRAYRRMSYAAMNEGVYCSNGVDRLMVNRSGAVTQWGVDGPGGQPILSLATGVGGAAAGTYQVAVTFVSANGEESGTGQAAAITVPAGGAYAITLSNIPQPPGSEKIRVYVSGADGTTLHHSYDLVAGTSTFQVVRGGQGKALETQFHDRAPAATIVRAYRGRLFLASGDTLYYTPALRYGLYKLHTDYFRFASPISMVEPVLNGLYVGTARQTFFLGGDDPTKMGMKEVDSFGVVPFTGMHTDRFSYDPKVPPMPCALWWSSNGVLICGRDDGTIARVTLNRLALPGAAAGATMLRETDGIRQIVSVLRGTGDASSLEAQDNAVATVIRNGVIIS